MFHKTMLGIQRGTDDKLHVRMEGEPKDILVLLSTLTAEVYAKIIEKPEEYNMISTLIQEGALRVYLAQLAEKPPNTVDKDKGTT